MKIWKICSARNPRIIIILTFIALSTVYIITTADIYQYLTYSENGFFNISASARGYLVRGSCCSIPDLDPFDKEIEEFVHIYHYSSCSEKPLLSYVEKIPNAYYWTLHIAYEYIHIYNSFGVICCYSNITRVQDDKKPDDTISISHCKEFEYSTNITEEFVMVKCVARNNPKLEVYKNTHAVVIQKPEVQEKIENFKNDGKNKLNVLLIGIDSMSRLNSIRTLQRTRNFMNNNGWIELRGYNKIADNTYPNLIALLTGTEGEKGYDTCKPRKLGQLDHCNFIWSKFSSAGYITAYGEDAAEIGTFNYNKLGFQNQPTNYYLRPYMLAAEKNLKTSYKHGMLYCTGPESEAHRILNYVVDFSTSFLSSKHPTFGLFWMNSFSHEDVNAASSMDRILLDFLETLHDTNVTENSFIVFFSDHGIRFGDMRKTMIGWFEDRTPFNFIRVPEWFVLSNPAKYTALRINSGRLTSPYDLYMTLQDVMVLNKNVSTVETSSGCPTCHSLFQKVNINRSCSAAGISPHWCSCIKYEPVETYDKNVRHSAAAIMKRLEKYIEDSGKDAMKNCAKFSLHRILMAQVGKNTCGDKNYLLYLEVLPGKAIFEGTVTIRFKNGVENFEILSSISRLNSYAGQSECVNDGTLKKYCFCR